MREYSSSLVEQFRNLKYNWQISIILVYVALLSAICNEGHELIQATGECHPCDFGFYKNVTGSHEMCYPCPENYTTRSTGKTSIKDCKPGK
jgi:hypothetical protein